MKLISWNVNGIRSVLRKGALDFVAKENPDVLCLQETKGGPHDADVVPLKKWKAFWNPSPRPGYSGTAVFSKIEPLKVTKGIGKKEHDGEGRVITAEYKDFFLVDVYVPNSQRTLDRLPYRMKWDADFLKYLKGLEKKKPVVFCGDLNVAHAEIDLTNPKSNVKNHGFTPEERAGFDKVVKAGFVDTFRVFEKGGGHYTWWSQMGNCRKRNIGWRIDYFVISESLKPRLKSAFILDKVMGSDHCPVGIILK